MILTLALFICCIGFAIGNRSTSQPELFPPEEIHQQHLTIPAIDRTRGLGDLFDETYQDFHNVGIFLGAIPQEAIEIKQDDEFEYKKTLISSVSDELTNLGLDLDAQISILSGLSKISVTTAGNFEHQLDSGSILLAVAASQRTYEYRLQPDSYSLNGRYIRRLLDKTKANYVVTSVIYGYRYLIKFEAIRRQEIQNLNAEASLGAELEELADTISGGLSASGKYKQLSISNDSIVKVTIKGDMEMPESSLTDPEQFLQYLVNENKKKLANRSSTKGQALFYKLTPIDNICQAANVTLRQKSTVHVVSALALSEAVANFEEIKKWERRLEQIEHDMKQYEQCVPQDAWDAFSNVKRNFSHSTDNYKFLVRKALVKERKGKPKTLEEVNIDYRFENFSITDMSLILKREIGPFRDMLALYKKLDSVNISCLDPQSRRNTFVLDHHEFISVLILYRSDTLSDFTAMWDHIILDSIRYCNNGFRNVTCVSLNCMFDSDFCSSSPAPQIRVFYYGQELQYNLSISNTIFRNTTCIAIDKKLGCIQSVWQLLKSQGVEKSLEATLETGLETALDRALG